MSGAAVAGVVCVVQTPFLADGSIDADTFVRQVDWLFDNGADGVATGMVSEVLRLSLPERDELAALMCGAAAGRGAAVVSVGAESTHIAVRQARHAAAVGADAVMATPPALVRASDEGLFGYFTAVADAAGVPVIVQDASGYVGSALSIDLQRRLYEELTGRCCSSPRHLRSARS